MTQGILIITGFNVSFYVSVKSAYVWYFTRF